MSQQVQDAAADAFARQGEFAQRAGFVHALQPAGARAASEAVLLMLLRFLITWSKSSRSWVQRLPNIQYVFEANEDSF